METQTPNRINRMLENSKSNSCGAPSLSYLLDRHHRRRITWAASKGWPLPRTRNSCARALLLTEVGGLALPRPAAEIIVVFVPRAMRPLLQGYKSNVLQSDTVKMKPSHIQLYSITR